MPTRRLPDLPGWHKGQTCRHPEHNPPGMMVYKPGVYEHVCPACKQAQIFTVPAVFCEGATR